MSVAEALDRACDVLRAANRVLLTSHRRPDGDGTGSMAGLASLLRAAGKEAVIYSMDPIARRYKWLPLVSETVHTMPGFLYWIMAAIGVLFSTIGAYVGERIQMGPPPKPVE